MRITNKKFNERPSNIKKIKKKIFFAFEGLRTEEIYFTSGGKVYGMEFCVFL